MINARVEMEALSGGSVIKKEYEEPVSKNRCLVSDSRLLSRENCLLRRYNGKGNSRNCQRGFVYSGKGPIRG